MNNSYVLRTVLDTGNTSVLEMAKTLPGTGLAGKAGNLHFYKLITSKTVNTVMKIQQDNVTVSDLGLLIWLRVAINSEETVFEWIPE